MMPTEAEIAAVYRATTAAVKIARSLYTRARIARNIATAAEAIARDLGTPAATITARAARRAADAAVYRAANAAVYRVA
jgi:hypothetical protein